jgi:aspartate aminotransferase-like enzyme
MIRVNHYGQDATREVVEASLTALGTALAEYGATPDVESARRAVAEAWQK